jgi:hypothetical protein
MATTTRLGTEAITIDGRVQIAGLDPRQISREDLEGLGHTPTPLLRVIREFCKECCGGSETEARRCVAVKCHLWPFRMATNPWREKRELSAEQRAEMAGRLAAARERR